MSTLPSRLALLAFTALLCGCGLLKKPVPTAPSNGQPVVAVEVPSLGGAANFQRIAQSGPVETYRAATPNTVSLERGVLVATRGLGHDLMAADASATLRALSALSAGGSPLYKRKQALLDGENHTLYINSGCVMQDKGREMVGQRSLRRFEESCQSRHGDYINGYWLDSAGRIVTSQQWAGPELGLLGITALQ